MSLPIISYHKVTGRYKTKRLEKDYPIYVVGKIVDEIIPKNDLIIGCLWGGSQSYTIPTEGVGQWVHMVVQ